MLRAKTMRGLTNVGRKHILKAPKRSKQQNEIMQKISNVLAPYSRIAYRDDVDSDVNDKAKKALQECRIYLEQLTTWHSYKTSYFGNRYAYLYGLQYIFFAIRRGNYCEACAEVESFIGKYSVLQERMRQILLFALQTLEKTEESETHELKNA